MTKEALRKDYLEKRKALSGEEVADLSREIRDNFFRSVDLSLTRMLHTFLPITKLNEPDTMQILDKIRKEYPGIEISIPRMEANGNLISYLLRNAALATNKWGVPEPLDGTPVDDTQIDLVIVPLLAFDEKGNRLGYGKGYYDRFLQKCRPDCRRIGLSFFSPVKMIDGILPHDQKVDQVITAQESFTFTRK